MKRGILLIVCICAVLATGCARVPRIQSVPPGQNPQSFEAKVVKDVSLDYLLYIPPEYAEDESKKWPMIVFLHGAGERGDDLEKVKVHGPPKLVSQGRDMPFVVVSPQCPEGSWWTLHTDALMALIGQTIADYRIDPDRVYLTGLSMGGFGTWGVATEHPDLFAAIAPICGRGLPWLAHRLEDTPTWVFHGAKDRTVPIDESEAMVAALKKIDAPVKYTVYPEAGHDSWTETYENPELYAWFLEHSR